MSDLSLAVQAAMPGVRADLERLVRIPSVAFPGFDHSHVSASAQAVEQLLREAGMETEIVTAATPEGEQGQPAVIGRLRAPEGAPTVLLYAHHDVQPPGDAEAWVQDDPFEPEERNGRLYGRGAADDKAGVMAHLAALRAFDGKPPVGVTIFLEGEEEFGSGSLLNLIQDHRDKLEADVVVIADSVNWKVGIPALTTSLRGLVNVFVDVQTLNQPVHSGLFGGPVPDSLTALCHVLAALHDENGDVAVEGLVARDASELDTDEESLRAESGMLPGTEFIGTGRLTSRQWTKPSATVLGISGPEPETAANALQGASRAKVSFRIAPGDNAESAFAAIKAHIEASAPWGATVSVTPEKGAADPCAIDATGPYFEAAREAFTTGWDGQEPVDVGIGGSIPMIAMFQEMFPQAAILVTGVEDPDSRAHGPNESVHLGEFERTCVAEAHLLANLAKLRK
ncbi:dipeptidase [Natronoglycomyces albus]|nr:dipeptidase [Natronoglycomyces albus]